MNGVPSYQEMLLPMLQFIAAGHATIAACEPLLRQRFSLSDEQASAQLPSGKQSYLVNRAHWARTYLAQAGLIEPVKRGHFRVTESGLDLLATHPATVTNATLRQFPAFRDFVDRSRRQGDVDQINVEPFAQTETPDDLIANAHAQVEDALAGELINLMLTMPPARFEQLIVDLLLAMGYGDGDRSMGQSIGKSGDGGIDGIINEDALGLDAVYIQAKRYAVDSKVGRPALQAFVGSLTGEGATKGVFVTTSDFSKEARDYVNKVQHRIVLINGDRLARLMIVHDIGVRARKTYVLRSVDEDYFSEY